MTLLLEQPGESSIRRQLVTTNLVTLGSVLVLVSVTLLVTQLYFTRNALIDDLNVQAEMIAGQSTAAIAFGDVATATETLASLDASPDVRQATLFLPSGAPFAVYRREGTELEAVAMPDSEGYHFSDGHLDVTRAVVHDGLPVGTLHIRAGLGRLTWSLATYTAIALALALAALAVGYALMTRLQRSITEPLTALATLSHRISRERDYHIRAPVDGVGEVGVLARNFNEMLAQIQTHDDALAAELAERRRAEERLDKLAHYDTVTGLPNRYYFNERLLSVVSRALRFDEPAGLMFLDVDNFKTINDTLGHHVGDELLREVAARLQKTLRHGDVVCRIGGDEFAIILEHLQDAAQADLIARKCIEAVAQPMLISGSEIYVTASVGVSLCPRDAQTANELLINADTAMYHAKAKGKNTWHHFEPDMKGRAQRRLVLENSLRRAVERNEFEVHYQPQIDLMTREMIGVEALIRWRHPDLGMVSPLEFIPVAEDTGLIVAIGGWVLRSACQQAREWADSDVGPLRVAINLSGRQFREEGLVNFVHSVLLETGLPPHLLELEITESTLMDVGPRTVDRLNEFRDMGIRLAIDDFGTGYSSMSYLKRFPIGLLKVDRAFVKDLPDDAEDGAITHAIIALSRSLRIDVIAEGVESEAQASFLFKAGCSLGQGYLFSKPVPGDEITRLVREGKLKARGRKA